MSKILTFILTLWRLFGLVVRGSKMQTVFP